LDFQERYDRRPLAVEIFHENYNPRVPRSSFGAWLHFMDHMGGLSTAQKELLQQKAGRFLLELETTPMTKSYKMLTLLAMLNADALPGQISLARLVDEVSRLARRTQRLQADITVPLDDQKKLTRLWKENPIAAWADRKGRDENRYFVYQDEHFQTDFLVQNDHVEAFQELVRELVDWRLADYLSKQETAFGNADRFVCRVIQSSGRPILKLPGKCEERHDPWGWNSVLIEGERYEAKFVKLFVNVISKVGTQENDLAPIMRRWFGEEAGQPGTRFQVAFERQDNGYHLMPLGQKATTRTAELWQTYRREDIPELFDLEFKKGTWQQQGFIREGKHTFLFVTLDKGDLGADFQHQDRFLSADRFQWQSQNRTTQQSKHGQSLVEHQEQGILIHLLVRRKKKQRGIVSPFYYCGELDFESWEGEKPITVWWRLKHAVPDHMHSLLQILANM
jgi:hypothetical protein